MKFSASDANRRHFNSVWASLASYFSRHL